MVLVGVVLTLGILCHAWPWIADDAFISLRYAERLLDGHGLTWNDGERVEGYSNLLWVLMNALLGALGCDLVTAVRVLGIACTLGAFAVLAYGGALPPRWPAQLALAVAAASDMVAVWAVGGLETPLLLLLLAIAVTAMRRGFAAERSPTRALAVAGGALALACWTRPDAPIWVLAAVVAGAVFGGSRRTIAAVWLGGLPLLAVAAQSAFRVAYYGDWVPNTARAKLPAEMPLQAGCDYAGGGLLALSPLLGLALIGWFGWARRRPPCERVLTGFAVFALLLWLAFVVRVGGDVFPNHRFFVPLLVPLAVLAARGLDVLAASGRRGAPVACLAAAIAAAVAWAEAVGHERRQDAWEWRALATGEWLGRAFAPRQPLLAVDAAGAVPFASRLPCVDMLGLCDRVIASTPAGAAHVVGHGRGNGDYVLSRRPDLVMFHIPPGSPQPNWLSGVEMERNPEFLRDYRAVVCDAGEVALRASGSAPLRLVMRVRLHGRVGVSRDAAGWSVPGWLLGSFRQTMSHLSPPPDRQADVQREFEQGVAWLLAGAAVGVLDERGELVGEIRAPGRFVVEDLGLPPGAHRVQAGALPEGVRCTLEASADGRTDLVCEVAPAAQLPVRIAAVKIVDG